MQSMDYGVLITKILTIVIEFFLPVLLVSLVRWANAHYAQAKAGQHGSEIQTAVLIISRLVRAAEQNGMIGAIQNIGEEKKRYVLNMAQAELVNRGINIDLDTLDALIEAEVLDASTDFDLLKELKGETIPVFEEPTPAVEAAVPAEEAGIGPRPPVETSAG